MQLLRSLLFNVYMVLSACVFGAFMSLCFWSPHSFQFAIARCWARCLLWVLARLCGLKFSVEGRERIPEGAHIVMSNHTSAWETIAQFVIFPPHVWVLKRELLWIPFVGWGLKPARRQHRTIDDVVCRCGELQGSADHLGLVGDDALLARERAVVADGDEPIAAPRRGSDER